MKTYLLLGLLSVAAVGCGDDETASPDLSAIQDLAVGADLAKSGDGGAMATLKVENYLNWCSFTINGGASSTAATWSMSFPVGTVVNLHAEPLASFVWGYWRGTAGDSTASHDTMMNTSVTMSADKTVQACCPFPPPAAQTCPDPT